jgi:hypothetical protein
MATDTKYGHVIFERGNIGDDEPVMVFRAQDALLPDLIDAYESLCRDAGSPQRHLDKIAEARNSITEWQARNKTRIPESNMRSETLNVLLDALDESPQVDNS